MDPWVRCHGMKANPTWYLWSKYECFLMSGCQDMDLSKTCDGNANANANADAKVTTIALPVLCTGELISMPYQVSVPTSSDMGTLVPWLLSHSFNRLLFIAI